MSRTAALLITPIVAAVLVAAQQANRPQSKADRQRSTPKKNTSTSAANRPAPAIENNVVQVIDSLVAAGAARPKGEYETTEQYEARLSAVAARYGQLSFLIADAKFLYDADAGEMQVSLSKLHTFIRNEGQVAEGPGDSEGETLGLTSSLVGRGSYIGTNEYGANAVVHSSTFAVRGLLISGCTPCFRSTEGSTGDIELIFPMGADQAKMIKPFLRAQLVGKLAEGRVYKGWGMVGPTLSVPYEIKYSGLYVPFTFEELRILDIRSGRPIIDASTPRLISTQRTLYDLYAKEDQKVVVRAMIAEDGIPHGVTVVASPSASLNDSAIVEVTSWRFSPGCKDGRPVATETTVEVQFKSK